MFCESVHFVCLVGHEREGDSLQLVLGGLGGGDLNGDVEQIATFGGKLGDGLQRKLAYELFSERSDESDSESAETNSKLLLLLEQQPSTEEAVSGFDGEVRVAKGLLYICCGIR